MQESAAQWLHQAVPAYNTLLEHISSLPYQVAVSGAYSTCITLPCINISIETFCLVHNEASQAPKGFRSTLHA